MLASALFYAMVHSSTKALASTESISRVVLFMCVVQPPIGLIFSLSGWTWPALAQLSWISWIVIIGISALSAHYCMTKAMQCAEVTTVLTLDFLHLPTMSVVGAWLYSEDMNISLLIGGGVMLLGNSLNSYLPTT